MAVGANKPLSKMKITVKSSEQHSRRVEGSSFLLLAHGVAGVVASEGDVESIHLNSKSDQRCRGEKEKTRSSTSTSHFETKIHSFTFPLRALTLLQED